jgi:hypothetical protein
MCSHGHGIQVPMPPPMQNSVSTLPLALPEPAPNDVLDISHNIHPIYEAILRFLRQLQLLGEGYLGSLPFIFTFNESKNATLMCLCLQLYTELFKEFHPGSKITQTSLLNAIRPFSITLPNKSNIKFEAGGDKETFHMNGTLTHLWEVNIDKEMFEQFCRLKGWNDMTSPALAIDNPLPKTWREFGNNPLAFITHREAWPWHRSTFYEGNKPPYICLTRVELLQYKEEHQRRRRRTEVEQLMDDVEYPTIARRVHESGNRRGRKRKRI